jgi:hypothetical protein
VIAHIAAERLSNQRLARPGASKVDELVAWFGVVQAQEYAAAKWALALRMRGKGTADAIEDALNDGRIIRTHVLRPTWHFVAAADIDWMLQLSSQHVHRRLAYAYRYYGLDSATRVRAAGVFERALSGGEHLTRRELGAHLHRARLPAKGVHLALLTVYAELEGVMCSGAQRGKDATYALLSTRVTRRQASSRDESLAELTRRYLRSHAPATIRDLAWWSGLSMRDVKHGLDMIGARDEVVDGHTYWRASRVPSRRQSPNPVHLVPIYDEYLVAYRDHSAVPRKAGFSLGPAVIIDGQVAGTWKAVAAGDDVVITVLIDRRLTTSERNALESVVERYGRHLEKPTSLVVKTMQGPA